MTATPSATTLRTEELSSEAGVLEEIFLLASRHDRKCITTRDALRDRLKLRGPGRGRRVEVDRLEAEVELNDYAYACFELCGAIAQATVARAPGLAPFSRQLAERGVWTELAVDELERILRPIFEESGIGDRFVP